MNMRAETQQSSSQPFWIGLILLLLSVLYLFPEIVFNAMLVATAGGATATEEDLKLVELFGRTTSGIGAVLLVLGFVLKGGVAKSKTGTVVIAAFVFAIVWPTVFFGQKYLIESFLIEPSSAEQRQSSYFAQQLRSALISNAVEIEGIPYDPKAEHLPSEKTFLALLGGLLLADTEMLASLDKQKEHIIRTYIKKKAYADFPSHYKDYVNMRTNVNTKFAKYQQSSEKYNAEINSSGSRSKKYWLEVEKRVKEGWSDYQAAEKSFDAKLEKKSIALAPKIHMYFKEQNYYIKHNAQSSLKKLRRGYAKEMKNFGLSGTPPEYWLKHEEADWSSKLVHVFSDEDAPDQLIYTNEVAHYYKLLRPKMLPKFKRETNGYEYGIKTLKEFRQHRATSALIRESLKKKGLVLPSSWKISQRRTFNRAVAKKVRAEADKAWAKEIDKIGLNIKPNRGWGKFQRVEGIQQKIKLDMGDSYVFPVLADWNNKMFLKKVVEPNIDKKTQQALEYINAQLPEYEDGGSLEKAGKDSLRANLIPPISMAISLFLIIFTIFKLPFSFVSVMKRKREEKERANAEGSVANQMLAKMEASKAASGASVAPNVQGSKWKPKALLAFVWLIILCVIFIFPFYLLESKYTTKGSTVSYFLDRVSESSSAMVSNALHWVLLVQPKIQPLGEAIEEKAKLLDQFKHWEPMLKRWDAPSLTSSGASKQVFNGKLPLIVNVIPSSARIQVLDIKPKYKRGMRLKPRDYRLKISAPGYQSVRKTISLKPDSTKFSVKLTKQ